MLYNTLINRKNAVSSHLRISNKVYSFRRVKSHIKHYSALELITPATEYAVLHFVRVSIIVLLIFQIGRSVYSASRVN